MKAPQPAFTLQAALFGTAVAIRLIGHKDFNSFHTLPGDITVAACPHTSIQPSVRYFGVGRESSDVVRVVNFNSVEERSEFLTTLGTALVDVAVDCPDLEEVRQQHVDYDRATGQGAGGRIVEINIVDLYK